MLDLSDTGGDLTLAIEGIKQLIDVTEVRNEKVSRVRGWESNKETKLGLASNASMGIPKQLQPT